MEPMSGWRRGRLAAGVSLRRVSLRYSLHISQRCVKQTNKQARGTGRAMGGTETGGGEGGGGSNHVNVSAFVQSDVKESK